MKQYLIPAAIVLMCLARPLYAEVMVTSSLEWLADHCIDSGVYTVTGVSKCGDSDSTFSVKLELMRALRGKPRPSLAEVYSDHRPRQARTKAIVAEGHEFLVCFQHYDNGDRWVLHLINLSHPQSAGFNVIAVTSRVKLLKDRKAIMDVFTARLKTHPKPDPVKVGDHSKDNRIELEFSSEVYQAIYSGSSCYLNIPIDLCKVFKTIS